MRLDVFLKPFSPEFLFFFLRIFNILYWSFCPGMMAASICPLKIGLPTSPSSAWCAVGTAPVPVEEEDPEDEDVDQDALSSEEEDPFSAFFGKTKNQTNEKIVRGKYTNFANSERYLLWQQHLYLLPPLQRCSASQSQGICVLGSWVKWSRDRDVGPTDVLCYQSAHWEVIQCQKIGSKKYAVYMTSWTSLQQYERRFFWPMVIADFTTHLRMVPKGVPFTVFLQVWKEAVLMNKLVQIWIQNSNDLKMFMKLRVIFSNGFVMFDTWSHGFLPWIL